MSITAQTIPAVDWIFFRRRISCPVVDVWSISISGSEKVVIWEFILDEKREKSERKRVFLFVSASWIIVSVTNSKITRRTSAEIVRAITSSIRVYHVFLIKFIGVFLYL